MKLKVIIICLFLGLLMIIFPNNSNAYTQYPELNGQYFYIKNAYTGKYLDVYNGIAGGTNVQQYAFLENQNRQIWYFEHINNGEYMIYSKVGSTTSGNYIYLNYALDVDNGINANGTEIHLWNAIGGNTQTYTITRRSDSTYIIWTKASNYTKVVSLSDYSCDNYVDIHQWEYSNQCHDHWILEPLSQNEMMGIRYAQANYNNRIDAYPNLTNNFGGDCTNFVSQCLLASGGDWHQHGTWRCRRKNTDYHTINNVNELNQSWYLTDPSPWISANELKEQFENTYDYSYRTVLISDMLYNPSQMVRSPYFAGDVVQIIDNKWNLGIEGDAMHTMYITDYGSTYVGDDWYSDYLVTYHSNDELDAQLLIVIQSSAFVNEFVRMYDCTE